MAVCIQFPSNVKLMDLENKQFKFHYVVKLYDTYFARGSLRMLTQKHGSHDYS